MPIFPIIEIESLVQESDKTRLNAEASFISGVGAITLIEIQPDADSDFYDVTSNKYLDWSYPFTTEENDDEETSVTRVVTVRVTSDEEEDPVEKSETITVIKPALDNLFSTDDRLRKHEPDIMKYVAAGRATFKDTHRRAQQLILAWLDTQGYVDSFGDKYTRASFVNAMVTEEVAEWATAMALRLIFQGVRNAVDDVFAEKAKEYENLELFYRNKAILRIDTNQDGQVDSFEAVAIRPAVVVRR